MNGTQIGLLSGLIPLVTWFSAPLWGGIAAPRKRHRAVLLLVIAGLWAAVLALTGFHYSAVRQEMALSVSEGKHFFSTGYAFGTCTVTRKGQETEIEITVREGTLPLHTIVINNVSFVRGEKPPMRAGETWKARGGKRD